MRDNDPCFIAVGIIVDAARLNRTKEAFGDIFEKVGSLFPEEIKELKASKLLLGRDRWRNVDPCIRQTICESLCYWIGHRKHALILTAIDRSRYNETVTQAPQELQRGFWVAGMTHLALQLQKLHQSEHNNKGRTILLIDDNKQFADHLAEVLWSPPAWTDTYYERGRKQEQLDQLIDSAFAVKSHHAGMVQVADLFALLFRRYAEIRDYHSAEEWTGEREYIDKLVRALTASLTSSSIRWPKRNTSPCAAWFNKLAPASLLGL
jgi:hypothetical protein